MKYRTSWLTRAAVTGALLAMAAIMWCDTPIHEDAGTCGGVGVVDDAVNPGLIPQPRSFSVDNSGICSEYSKFGWDSPLYLYLGEGAEEHVSMIRQAVDVWNEALMGFNRTPIVRIVTDRTPTNFLLDEGFWQSRETVARSHVYDGQSVIYFKASPSLSQLRGYAYRRWNPEAQNMLEADIYINTDLIREYGTMVYKMEEIYRTKQNRIVFARVDRLYLTTLHEIGHALGLNHLPVAGNIMSYNYMPRMVEIWQPVMAMADRVEPLSVSIPEMFSPPRTSTWAYVNADSARGEELKPVVKMFTDGALLGNQDKMALMCVYEFANFSD